MSARAACACALLTIGAVFGVAGAAGAQSLDTIGGFDIRSDSIDYNYTTGAYKIPSRFTAVNGNTDISADRATGNSKQKILSADGNVIVHQNGPLQNHGAQAQKFTQVPSTLTCDHLDADGSAKTYTATGNVHFIQGQREATGDRGTLNDATNQLHMDGHVTIKDGDQTLSADAVDYNTETGMGTATGNVTVLSPVPPPPPGPPGGPPKPKKHHP
ncbi:MAG TPA: OstA-like protein [Candidatus Acidoferrales bacterium]|nr:OstA-like protein [Candidatus Acidoferrales bacterium]